MTVRVTENVVDPTNARLTIPTHTAPSLGANSTTRPSRRQRSNCAGTCRNRSVRRQTGKSTKSHLLSRSIATPSSRTARFASVRGDVELEVEKMRQSKTRKDLMVVDDDTSAKNGTQVDQRAESVARRESVKAVSQ